MVAFPISRPIRLPLTPLSAVAVAAAVVAGCLFVPTPILETAVLESGIAALLPAAAPPLGETARLALAVTASAGAGALAWLAAFLILGGEGVVTLGRSVSRAVPAKAIDVPVLRRADAHPDAPARAPLMAARDLGVPFLAIRAPKPVPPVERALPRDLDAPLSAFDPSAIPDEPAAPIPSVPALSHRPEPAPGPTERIETFELHPPAPLPTSERPIAAPRTDATIHALLDRLERGVTARADSDPQPKGLDSTLAELRRLAAS